MKPILIKTIHGYKDISEIKELPLEEAIKHIKDGLFIKGHGNGEISIRRDDK